MLLINENTRGLGRFAYLCIRIKRRETGRDGAQVNR